MRMLNQERLALFAEIGQRAPMQVLPYVRELAKSGHIPRRSQGTAAVELTASEAVNVTLAMVAGLPSEASRNVEWFRSLRGRDHTKQHERAYLSQPIEMRDVTVSPLLADTLEQIVLEHPEAGASLALQDLGTEAPWAHLSLRSAMMSITFENPDQPRKRVELPSTRSATLGRPAFAMMSLMARPGISPGLGGPLLDEKTAGAATLAVFSPVQPTLRQAAHVASAQFSRTDGREQPPLDRRADRSSTTGGRGAGRVPHFTRLPDP